MKLNHRKLKEIEKLNKMLVALEESIYNRLKEYNQLALKILLEKENGIYNYELEVNIAFYHEKSEEEIISWSEKISNTHFLDETKRHCNINDKKNHNVTSCYWQQKALNSQNHCWILHQLYDDFQISWSDIVKIDTICFDIHVRYQYMIN